LPRARCACQFLTVNPSLLGISCICCCTLQRPCFHYVLDLKLLSLMIASLVLFLISPHTCVVCCLCCLHLIHPTHPTNQPGSHHHQAGLRGVYICREGGAPWPSYLPTPEATATSFLHLAQLLGAGGDSSN
jgi:hypothetical protein